MFGMRLVTLLPQSALRPVIKPLTAHIQRSCTLSILSSQRHPDHRSLATKRHPSFITPSASSFSSVRSASSSSPRPPPRQQPSYNSRQQRPQPQTSQPGWGVSSSSYGNDHQQYAGGFGSRTQYNYFKNRVPFYYTRKFWIYVGVVSVGGTLYYISHLEYVPISGRRRFMDLSKYEEDILAQQAYNEIMTQFQNQIVPAHHPYSMFVRRVAENIIRVSGLTDLEWEVYLIDQPDQRNAFVLPGGKVFVFTGILPIVQDENGLAAVLGHEVAHQVARHSAEKMSWVKVVMVAQLLLSVFMDTGFLFNRFFLEFGFLMPFSRMHETEADYIGLKLMAQACYDPHAAISMWERMKRANENDEPMEFMSTHPSNSNRIQKIQEWMPEAMQVLENSDCEHNHNHMTVLGPIISRLFSRSI